MNKLNGFLVGLAVVSVFHAPAILAQSITPTPDGTGTEVTSEGNQFNITGGTLSPDNSNLFHSFEQFGLDAGQVANFLTSPEIQNILGRVTGGNASIINGLIQVTGGNSNLFLMNPAGILFGPNAALNVPASFTATSATGIGFGNDWFNAVGENNWANLVGTPSQFAFDITQPGAIANLGNLTLSGSHDLTLLGGTVLNAGTLSAPGGNITIAAVPGESRVRISQENHLLSLDLTPSGTTALTSQLTPLSLPELLTGSGVSHATQVEVNPDGSITLTGSQQQIPLQPGDAIASGEVDTVGETGGIVQVLGERVAVVDGTIDASGINGGGTVLIGGEYQGKGPVPNASNTFVSQDSMISADAISQGDGGRVIIWADDTAAFHGTINARGGVERGNEPQNGGFIEVSGKENLLFRGSVDLSAPYGSRGTLLLDPVNIIIKADDTGEDDNQLNADVPVGQAEGVILWEDGGDGDYTLSEFVLQDTIWNADLILEATNDITIEDMVLVDVGKHDRGLTFLWPGSGSIVFRADADNNGTGSFIMKNVTQAIETGGMNISISAAYIEAGHIDTRASEDGGSINGDAGSITLTATHGYIQTGNLYAQGTGAGHRGGNINIEARQGSVTTGSIDSGGLGNGGSITLTATNGSIQTGNLITRGIADSGVAGNGGAVTLNATGGVTSAYINTISESKSSANSSDGGDINIFTSHNDINIQENLHSASISLGSSQNGGNIVLQAPNGSIYTRAISTASRSRNGTAGNGGSINIEAGNLFSSINLDPYWVGIGTNSGGATGSGDGGPINLTAPQIEISSLLGMDAILWMDTTPGMYTTNQPIAIQGNVTLNSPITLATGNAPITVTGLVDGNHPLILNTGTGNISITGAIGSVNPIADLTANSTGITTFGGPISAANLTTNAGGTTALNGNVTTTGATGQIYGDNVTTTGDITFTGSALNFGGTVSGTGNLTLNSSGLTRFAGSVNAGSLTTNAGGTTELNGNVTTTGAAGQVYGDDVTTIGDIILTGNELNFGGNVTGTGRLTLQPFTPSQAIAVGVEATGYGTTDALDLTTAEMARLQNGFSEIYINTTGTINTGTLSVKDPLTLQGGTLSLGGNITGTDDASISLNSSNISLSGDTRITTNSQDITFSGSVNGGSYNLTTEAWGGSAILNGDMTVGNLTFNNTVTLNGDTILTADEVNFGSGVTGTGYHLTLQPNSPSSAIAIGGSSETSAFDITTTELGKLQNGFGRITIGRSDGNGAITIENPGVTFQDPVTLRSPLAVGTLTTNGPITLTDNATLTLEIYQTHLNHNITGTNPTGNAIDFGSGLVQLGNSVTVNSNGGNVSFGGAVDGNYPLTVNAGSGDLTFGSAIGGSTPLTRLSVTAGNTEIANNITTNNGNITLNSPTTLTGTSAINAGTGTIEFNKTFAAGSHPLTLTADEINLLGGNNSVSGSSSIVLQPATASLPINIGYEVDNIGELDITQTDLLALQNGFSSITFGSASGSGAIDMGTVTFYDPVILRSPQGEGTLTLNGAVTLLDNATLTRDIAGLTTLLNDITTDGTDIIFEEDVLLGADITLSTGQDKAGNIIFQGLLDGTRTLHLTSGLGYIDFQRPVGVFEPIGNLAFGPAAEIKIGGGIRTDNSNLTFNSPVTLQGDSSFNTGRGILTFNDAISAGSHGLILAGDEINLNAPMSGSHYLEIQPASATQGMNIAGTDNNTAALDITQSELNLIEPGFSEIRFGQSSGSGTINVNSLTVGQPTTIRSGVGVVNLNGALTATGNASVTLEAQTTNLHSNITTAGGAIALNGGVQLPNDVTLTSNSGDVTFTGTIDGANSLSVNAGSGNVRFGGVAGGVTPLAGLEITAGETFVNGGGIYTQNSPLTFNSPVTVSGNSILSTGTATLTFNHPVNAGTGDLTLTGDEINFGDRIRGTGALVLQPATPSQGIAIGGSGNTAGLDITASELAQFQDGFRSIAIGRTNGSGSVVIQSASFNDPVAVRSPAGDITVNGAVSGNGGITLNASTLNLNSELSNTGGELNLTGDTQITNAVNLSNTGNISLSGAINGSGSLNITAGSSDVTFGGAIGSITPLEQITVTAGNVTVNGAVATTNGITLDSPVTVSNSGGTFNAGTGSLALSSSLTSQFQDLIFTGSEIDLGGRLSGSGQVFLQPANPSTNIAVGGSGTTTGLDLTATELANFGSGFRSVTIGRTDGSGNITIGSTSLPVPTTILSPTGAIALDGTITSTGGLTLTAPTLTLNAASIDNTTGPVNLQGQTEINNAVNITNNGNITLTSAVDGSGELTLDSGSGNVLLRGAVGSSSPLQQLTLNGNLATVNGAVATTNGITLNSPIELGANGGNFSAGSGPLTLGSTLTANTQNLTLTANDINLGGVVRGIGNLVLEPTNPSQSMAIGDANANAEFTLTAADIANLQDGFTGVTIGRSDGSGTVAIANITLPDPTIVQVPLEPGSISVTGNTTLVGNGSLTLIAPQTQLGGNITSENGNIALNSDAIQLSNDVTLSTQDAGNITLSGTINGANQLTLNAGGNVELGNSLGNITALTGLTVRGQNLALNGDITTNQGNVSIDAPISLQRDTAVITGSDATGYGDVTATSTIDGNYRLLINAGNVRVDGAIGGNEPLESVTIVAEPEINLQDVTTDGGDVDLQAVDDIITGDIITTPSTPLPAGDITLTSTEGGVTTGNLDASGPGTGGNIAIAGDRDIITGDITTSSDSASAGDITVTSHQGSITTQDIRAESLGLTSGTLNLDAGNSINTGNINQSGGNIRLRAAQTITTGNISSRSETGPGGQVELEANGDITTGDITTNGFLNAGNVLINSILGNITTGNILSTSTQGAGGTVDLNAAGNVSTGTINTSGEVEAGVVNLVSAGGGTISTGNITALSELGGPGEVNISTSGEVNTGVIKVTPEQPRSPEESTRIEPASDLPPQAAENVPTTEETVTDAPSTNPSAEPPAEPAVATSELPGIETEPEIETATPAVVVPPAIAPTEVLQPPPQPVQSPEPEATTPVPAAVEEHHIPPTDSGHSEIAPMETAPDAVIAMPEGNIAQDLIPSSQPLEIVTNPGNVQTPQSTVVNNPVSTSQILDIARYNLNQNLASGNLVDAVGGIEEMRSQEFADYFGSEFQEVPTSLQGIRDSLGNITRETGSTPGIIYTLVQPEQLELILITANGAPIRRTVATDRETLLQAVTAFRGELTTPNRRHSQNYLRSAQQLYQWLIAPIQPELEANGIDTLLFSMDSGLRALPIAALHDGEQFLIEKYPIALIPSISLTNMRYRSLANTRVLAMGASTFTELNPLPAVPVELSTITEQLWQGVQLLNADFTRANLMATRHDYPYEIIHLATHGEFNSGALSNSYIQLWDEKLGLDQLRTLGWQNPQVELLVLSACRTALGDEKAELGFAGFAVQAGVKTAIASLWYVSDEGTLALMSEFYRQLSTAPLKAEALRQAQIAMIRGNVQIENGILRFRGESEGISLPPEFFATQTTLLSHPYYWSAFTTIGSPW